MRPPRSFTARLLAGFVLFAIAPAALLAGIAFRHLQEADQEDVLERLTTAARSRGSAIAARIAEFRSHARLLALHDRARVGARLGDFLEESGSGVGYGFVDASGRADDPSTGTLTPRQVEALRAGGTVVDGERVVVGAALPDGGAALTWLPAQRIYAFLQDVEGLRSSGQTYLLDAEGRLLGGNRPEQAAEASAAASRGWAAQLPDRPGLYRNYAGREVLGAWAPAGDWTVVAEMDRAEAVGPLRELGLQLLGLGALFFLLVAAALLWMGRRVQRSVRAMVASLERASRGEFGGEVEAPAFAEMAKVQHAIDDMHRRLAERDAEIMRQRQELFCQRCELERLNHEIVAADRMKSEFVANMSHEVRTPLHSILTLSSVLQRETSGTLNDEQRRQAGIIERNGLALLAMLGDILDFSKIEAGRVSVAPKKVVPAAVLAGVREAVAPMAREKGLDLVLDAPEGLPPVVTDPEKLHRVLLNLAHNAVKFTDTGSVTLGVKAGPRGGVVFRVADTGAGIAEDQRERIFEPFRQADGSTTRVAGGTGLGLSIARTLTELLGGRIALESAVGRGTTFTVVLPPRIPARAPAAGRPVMGEKDVLVVGASQPAGDAVRSELGVAGFHVGRAVCGRDIVTAVERTGVGAILLDLGIFANEGLDVFSMLAPRFAERAVPLFGYWFDIEERRGGFCGRLRVARNGDDGCRLEGETIPPLDLPGHVSEGDRHDAAAWTRSLLAGPAEPFHAVLREIARRLDPALARSPATASSAPGDEVLLLDPDPDTRYSMSLQIEQMGFQARSAPDLASVPADCRPSVVVTEARLPGVADPVAAIRARFDVPVLVLTADARAETRSALEAAGAARVLVKPAPAAALLQALRGARQGVVA